MPKPSVKLQINLTEPPKMPSNNRSLSKRKNRGSKASKQLQIRQKHQIEQMQNEVRKLNDKIQSERQLLRNRIITQQLEHELKKNQIASKMSKRQIILKRLQILKEGGKQSTKKREKAINSQISNINKDSQIVKQEQNTKSLPRLPRSTPNSSPRKLSAKQQIRITLKKKQKQYGNRVQRQYHQNRARSALSYIQIQKLSQLRKSQQQQDRNRILQQLKKPAIPIRISQNDKQQEIEKICRSAQSVQHKLKLLNYLSEVQLNKIKLKEVQGKQQSHMDILNCINRARTQILLKQY